MFLIYINDLPNSVLAPVEMALFADDSKLFCEVTLENKGIILQESLQNVYDWSKKWEMKFNCTKCHVLPITNRKIPIKVELFMGDHKLSDVTKFNDLGININQHFTWSEHIHIIKGKAMRNLGFIKRTLGYKAPMQAKKSLYMVLVRSVVSYSTQLWSPYLKKDIACLESIQREATRYLTNNYEVSYKERLNKCELLPLSYMREVFDYILFYNIINQRLDIDIDRYFVSAENIRRGDRTGLLNFVVRKCKTEKAKNFYTIRIIHLWNLLPPEIKEIPPPINPSSKPIAFKRALYRYYTNKLKNDFDVLNPCTWVSKCNCVNCRPY
jgi:hypothetical protein